MTTTIISTKKEVIKNLFENKETLFNKYISNIIKLEIIEDLVDIYKNSKNKSEFNNTLSFHPDIMSSLIAETGYIHLIYSLFNGDGTKKYNITTISNSGGKKRKLKINRETKREIKRKQNKKRKITKKNI